MSKILFFALSSVLFLVPCQGNGQSGSPGKQSGKGTALTSAQIDTMVRAHVQDYFADENAAKSALQINLVNGIPFDKLKHGMTLGQGGGVEYSNGKPIPLAGSPITATLQQITQGVLHFDIGFDHHHATVFTLAF